MSPLIYFSYGMTKSGSTLSFELARSAFVINGWPQERLSLAAVENRKNLNFCGHIDEKRAQAIQSDIAELNHPVAIKTHTRPDPEVVKMLQSNKAFAHATFRDPRDIALSMVDHGRKSREKGAAGFSEYLTVEDTIEDIRHQTNSLLAWLSLPNVKPLYYDDVAFNMRQATSKMMSDLGVAVDVRKVIKMATKDRFTQKNKARQARYKTEMNHETSAQFARIFAPLFDRLITKRQNFPDDGTPVLDHTIPLCDWSETTTSKTGRNS